MGVCPKQPGIWGLKMSDCCTKETQDASGSRGVGLVMWSPNSRSFEWEVQTFKHISLANRDFTKMTLLGQRKTLQELLESNFALLIQISVDFVNLPCKIIRVGKKKWWERIRWFKPFSIHQAQDCNWLLGVFSAREQNQYITLWEISDGKKPSLPQYSLLEIHACCLKWLKL